MHRYRVQIPRVYAQIPSSDYFCKTCIVSHELASGPFKRDVRTIWPSQGHDLFSMDGRCLPALTVETAVQNKAEAHIKAHTNVWASLYSEICLHKSGFILHLL